MRGLKPENVPVLVARDVEMVEKEAKIVLDISNLQYHENPKPGLGIIAVVGPGDFLGRHFEKAVLCEIGLGKSRPYHQAKKPESFLQKGEASWKQKRRKWFCLDEEKYLIIAPLIFQLLQKLTDERGKGWQLGPSFTVKGEKARYLKRTGKVSRYETLNPVLNGGRFAVSTKDELLLRDIFWAELNLNERLRNYLNGLMGYIDLCLAPYKKGFRVNFLKLKRVKDVVRDIDKRSKYLLPYLLVEMLNYLRDRQENPLWPHYCELFGWDGNLTKERQLASLALPDPKKRLENIQLRITTGLEGRNKYNQYTATKRDHIVIEVYPSKPSTTS